MTRVSTHTPRSLEGKSRQHAAGIDSLSKRPGFEPGGGVAVYEIKVFEDVNELVAGDGAFWWPIPEDLDGAEIIVVEAGVSTPSSSGSVQVQIRHFQGSPAGSSGDVLTTVISIDVGEYNSKDAAVQPVIAGGAYEVAHGDWLRIDVDAAGTGAKGLAVMVGATPSPLGSVTIQGAKGDTGGVTSWTGAWSTTTTYVTNESVSHNGTSYVAIQGSTDVEPGVDVGWEDYWQVLAESGMDAALEWHFDGSGYPIDPGVKTAIEVPWNCTIVEAVLAADRIGSLVVDVWRDTYDNYPPTDADSITGASPPTLNVEQKSRDQVLSGWSTSLVKGDWLIFNVDSCSLVTRGTLSLKVVKA